MRLGLGDRALNFKAHTTAKISETPPAYKQQGEGVILLPAVNSDHGIRRFLTGVKVLNPYLRYTPQPVSYLTYKSCS